MSFIIDQLRTAFTVNSYSIEVPGQMMHEVLNSPDAQRRIFLRGGAGAALAAAFGGSSLLAGCGGSSMDPVSYAISFKGIPAITSDTVVVPEGYTAQVLFSAGDPVVAGALSFAGSPMKSDAIGKVSGGQHDGMHFYPLPGVDPNLGGLLAINHEWFDFTILQPHTPTLTNEDAVYEELLKTEDGRNLMRANIGVSIIEVALVDGKWVVKRDSKYNKRYNGNTVFGVTGPAASVVGSTAIGTQVNCASGMTPWGTYLTCEETTVDYLVASPAESNSVGWVVEIDPLGIFPAVKRTALGRFDHENTAYMLDSDNTLAIYMGDDMRGGCVYKFVAANKYNPLDRAANQNLLDSGTLYVAKFNADGTGLWIELSQGKNGLLAGAQDPGLVSQSATSPTPTIIDFRNQADVLINTKAAARVAGGTLMDRPEWVSVGPDRRVYCTFTNNSSRAKTDAANPRLSNSHGHILRWTETGSSAKATTFAWEVFILGGDARLTASNLKGNIIGDTFSSPDGISVDTKGRLWVQTDASTSSSTTNTFGNNAMYSIDPETKRSTRFLTGPNGSEITGLTYTPDLKTFFINIQHPTTWPGTVNGRGLSSTIVVRRTDGSPIGS